MKLFRVDFCRQVPFTFLRDTMQEHRSLQRLSLTKGGAQIRYTMTVYRSKVGESQFLKDHSPHQEILHTAFNP